MNDDVGGSRKIRCTLMVVVRMLMLTAILKKGYVDGASKNAYVLKKGYADGGSKNVYIDSGI